MRCDLPQLSTIEIGSGRRTLRIDDQGVLVRRLLCTRLLRWEDVVEVRIGTFSYYWQQIAIKTSNGRQVITHYDDPRLQACIWQHLRKHGKADLIELSDEAESFWYEISDAIPQTMTWAASTQKNHPEFGRVERVELRDDGISVTERGRSVDLQWTEISDAEWLVELDELATIGLLIGTPNKLGLLRIPLFDDDPECVKLMLAIVRRLRIQEHAPLLHIPREIFAREWRVGAISDE